MRHFMIWAVAALLFASSALAAPATQWQSYEYKDLGFSIELPGAPTRTSTNIPIDDKTSIKAEIFSLTDNATYAIMIATTDYAGLGLSTAMFADPAIQNKLLEAGVQGALSESKSVLVSQKTIMVQGVPGREIVIKSKTGDMIGQFDFLLSGSVLYEVGGAGLPAKGIPPAFERVWRSFRLLGRQP